jgi:PTH1 family peptidyl-tRNA hydrolase
VDKVIVGLGNPGSRYEGTRHNVGWMVLDHLAARGGATGRARARDGAASVHARLDGLDLLLVKPTTYMNLSGSAVRSVLARERAPIRDLLVVMDDLALPFGRLRIRERGSDGGHNGLRSIIGELGTQEFARLRIGIGEPARGDARQHVLGDFRADERTRLTDVLEAAADCVLGWATEGPAAAAATWNGWRPVEPGALADTGSEVGDVVVAASRPDAPTPDANGIVRSTTGWRRLLRRPDRDPGASDR